MSVSDNGLCGQLQTFEKPAGVNIIGSLQHTRRQALPIL